MFTPQQRGKCVVLLDCFWALGACLEVGHIGPPQQEVGHIGPPQTEVGHMGPPQQEVGHTGPSNKR